MVIGLLFTRRSLIRVMLILFWIMGVRANGQTVFVVTDPIANNDTINVCQGNGVEYFAFPFGFGSPTFLWSFSGGTPATGTGASPGTITYSTNGTYETVLIVSDGTNTSTDTLIVVVDNTPPVVNYTPSQTSFCSSDGLHVLTGGSPSGGVFSGPGVIDGVFYPDSAGAGIHAICYTYTAPNGCSATDCENFTLTPGPDASIEDQNVFTPFSHCIPAGGTPNYNLVINNTSATSGSNISYFIDWGDGSPPYTGVTLPNGTSHNYTAPGNYIITVVVESPNGCTDTSTYNFFNGQNPSVGIGIGASQGCVPFTLDIPILNVASNPPGTTYELSFGDGTVMYFNHPPPDTVSYTYTESSCGSTDLLGNPNSFHIQLRATNPCGTSQALALPIELSRAPDLDLQANDSTICVGQTISLNDLSDSALYVSGGTNCATNYIRDWNISPATGWTIDDPNSPDPNITFQDTGIYTVCLEVSHPCGSDSACITICVSEPPELDVNATVSGVCAPVELVIEDNSEFFDGCITPTTGFTWTGGNYDTTWVTVDPVSGDTSYHFIFTELGSHSVTYTASNECGNDTWQYNFEVGDSPVVDLGPDRTYCDLRTIDFDSNPHDPDIDDNNNPITDYEWTVNPPTGWNFTGGTGADDPDPQIEFTDTGTYEVCLVVINTCGSDTACQTFTFTGDPEINVSPDTTICSNGDATIWVDIHFGIPPLDIEWRTVPPSGFNSNDDTVHLTGITSTTTYRATVTDSLGCEAEADVTVFVNPELNVDAGADFSICATDSFNLSGNISSGTPPYDFYWSPGTLLNDSTLLNPRSDPIAGDTTFTLYVVDSLGCTASDQVTVSLHVPVTVVSAGPDTVFCDSPFIESLSGSPAGGTWSGPGVVPPDGFDPSAAGVGTHTLVYTFTDGNGCTGSDTIQITVTTPVQPTALADTTVCEDTDPIALHGSPAGGIWTVSHNSALLVDSTFNPNIPGVYTLYYTIGTGSCLMSDSIEIVVLERPDLGGPYLREICSGDSILFVPNPDVTGSSVQWASVAGTNITGNTSSGTGNITDTLFNASNTPDTVYYTLWASGPAPFFCDGDSTLLTVVVHPRPEITNPNDTFEICSGGLFEFEPTSDISGSSFTYSHVSSDPGIFGASGSLGNIADVLTNNGAVSGWVHYHVFVFGPGPNNCAGDTFDVYVLVHPLPDADAGIDLAYCSSDSVQLQSVIPVGTIWSWSPATGLNDPNSANPYVTSLNTGSSDITNTYILTITDTVTGCVNSDTVDVTIHPLPDVDPGPDRGICIGLSTTIGTTGDPDYTYQWSVPGGSFSASTATVTVSPDSTTTYRLIQTHTATGCLDSADVTVTVIAAPVAGFIPSDTAGCAPLNIALTDTSTTGVNHQWFVNGVSFSNQQNPNIILTNTSTTEDSTYIITLIITAGTGCSDTVSQEIIVSPNPVADFSLPTPFCSPDTVTVTQLSSYPPGTTFQWGVSSTSVGILNPASSTPGFVFPDFHGTTDSTYTIWMVISSPNGCSDSTAQNVVVLARPTASLSLPAPLCGPATITVNSTATGSGISYLYSVVPGAGVTITDPTDVQPQISFPSSFADSVVYTVYQEITDDRGCSHIDSARFVVYPTPTAGFVPSQIDSCGPLTVQFTNTSTPNQSGMGLGDMTFNWNFGNGTGSTDVHPSALFVNTGSTDTNYIVTLIATNAFGCSDTIVDTITVHPDPVADFAANPLTACAPFTIDTSVIDVTLYPTVNDLYIWEVVDPATGTVIQTLNGPDAINYTLTDDGDSVLIRLIVTSLFGCRNDSADLLFRSIDDPVASFAVSPDSGCSPLNVSFTSTSTPGVNHEWFVDGISFSTSANPNIVLTNTSTSADSIYTIRLIVTAASGCSDTTDTTVTVFARPEANYSFTETCLGGEVTFLDASNSTVTIVDWQWDFGDGQSASTANPTHLYANPGVYPVSLTITDTRGCSDVFVDSVTVRPLPIADFTASSTCGSDTLCLNTPANFADASTIAAPGGNIVIWLWDIDGDNVTDYTGSNITHTFTDTGYIPVQLIVETEFGCRDTVNRSFYILSPPLADFELDVYEGCGDLQVNATNLSGGTIHSYHWEVYADDGAGGRVVLHTSNSSQAGAIPLLPASTTSDTTYFIELTVGNCCGFDTITRTVTVHPNPVAGMLPDNNDGCSPFNVEFQLDSRVSGNPDYLVMDYGDGQIDTIYPQPMVFPGGDTVWFWGAQSHTFSYGGTALDTSYTVTQYTYNQCGTDSVSVPIIVRTNTVNAFIDALPREGCAPLTVNFANASYRASSFNWCLDYDTITGGCLQPATGDTIVYTYTQPGTYTVALFANDGCSYDTAYVTIEVYGVPNASFTANSQCIGDSVSFVNTSTLTGGTIAGYHWDFGDGNTSILTNPEHLYANPGIYNVSLIVESANGCSDTTTQTVTVYPGPQVDFDPFQICFNQQPFTFNNLTDTISAVITSTLWNFGDGNSSTAYEPTHQYTTPGSYTVTLFHTTANGCIDSAVHQVDVYPLASASFTAALMTGSACILPQDWGFTNTSVGASDYLWDFDLNNPGVWVDTLEHPLFTYTQPGVYRVGLIAYSANGCPDTAEMIIEVPPYPIAQFGPPSSGCAPHTTTFVDSSVYNFTGFIVTRTWDLGDGTVITGNQTQVTHTYTVPGNYTVTLIIETDRGCIDTLIRSQIVTVYPEPEAAFTYQMNSDGSVQFINQSQHIDSSTTWYWTFGDGNTSEEMNPVHSYDVDRYETSHSFYVCLRAGNDYGCPDSICIVFDLPGYLLEVPNAFAPDLLGVGDGNVFLPKGNNLARYELKIFDTYGNLVFETHELESETGIPNEPWNGTFMNEGSDVLPSGAYVWKINAIFIDGAIWRGKEYKDGRTLRFGTVTLIR